MLLIIKITSIKTYGDFDMVMMNYYADVRKIGDNEYSALIELDGWNVSNVIANGKTYFEAVENARDRLIYVLECEKGAGKEYPKAAQDKGFRPIVICTETLKEQNYSSMD